MKILFVGSLLASLAVARGEDASFADGARLEDLGTELLKPALGEPAPQPDPRPLELRGEAVGDSPSAPDPWFSQVVGHMQTAQSLLQRSDQSGAASAAQAEALTGLDAMIAELTLRQHECSVGKRDQPGQSQPGQQPAAPGTAGRNPARAAPSATQRGVDLSRALAVAGDRVKDLWGKLPERQRQQILQPLDEEFLPQYASEIEAYFRALADPDRTAPKP